MESSRLDVTTLTVAGVAKLDAFTNPNASHRELFDEMDPSTDVTYSSDMRNIPADTQRKHVARLVGYSRLILKLTPQELMKSYFGMYRGKGNAQCYDATLEFIVQTRYGLLHPYWGQLSYKDKCKPVLNILKQLLLIHVHTNNVQGMARRVTNARSSKAIDQIIAGLHSSGSSTKASADSNNGSHEADPALAQDEDNEDEKMEEEQKKEDDDHDEKESVSNVDQSNSTVTAVKEEEPESTTNATAGNEDEVVDPEEENDAAVKMEDGAEDPQDEQTRFIDTLTKENDDANTRIAALTKERNAAVSNLLAARSKVRDLRKELRALMKEKNDAKKAADSAIQDLKNDNAALKRQYDELVDSSESDSKAMNEAVGKLQAKKKNKTG